MRYVIVDLFYDYSNILFLRLRFTFRLFFLLFLVYIIRNGNRFKFEKVFQNVFCCLNVFIFYDFYNLFKFLRPDIFAIVRYSEKSKFWRNVKEQLLMKSIDKYISWLNLNIKFENSDLNFQLAKIKFKSDLKRRYLSSLKAKSKYSKSRFMGNFDQGLKSKISIKLGDRLCKFDYNSDYKSSVEFDYVFNNSDIILWNCVLKTGFIHFRYNLVDFLNSVFFKLFIDFKLILFDINKRRTRKKCHVSLNFEDLICDHSKYYTQAKSIKTFLIDLKLSIKKRREMRKKKKTGFFKKQLLNAPVDVLDPETHKPKVAILQPITLHPVCVSFEYKRLKVFVFLFKGAKLQEHKCLYIRLAREFLMSFCMCSLSFYVVSEILELSMSHRFDIQF